MKAVGSPAIYYGGVYAEGSQILKQIKEKGITAQFVSGDGIDSGELVRLAGDAANGVYFTPVVADTSKTPEGEAFAKRYTQLAKKDLDSYSAYAYDSALLIINALTEYAKANPGMAPGRKELAELVRKTAGFKGIAGTHSYDAKGDDKEAKASSTSSGTGSTPGC